MRRARNSRMKTWTGTTAIGLLAVCVAAVAAQPERVMIGARPASEQTARMRLMQEMDFLIAPIGDKAGAPDPMRMTGVTSIVMRQQTGKVESDGRLRLELVYEEMSQKMEMNGEPAPIPEGATAGLLGKPVTVWMDPTSQILDVTVPDGFPLTADQMKATLTAMVTAIPHQEMSVGEVVTTPFSTELPIPILGGSGAAITGTTKTTLVKVTPAGAQAAADRLATLDQKIDARMDATPDTPAGAMHVRFTLSGAGTTDFDVRAGLVHTSQTTTKVDGTIEPKDAGAPAMKMSGTMIQKVERLAR